MGRNINFEQCKSMSKIQENQEREVSNLRPVLQKIRFYTKYETSMRGPRMSFHHLQEYGNVPMHFAPNGNCCNKLFAPFYIYGKDTFGTQNSTYKRLLRLRVCLCLIAYRTTRAASHTMRHFWKKINVRQGCEHSSLILRNLSHLFKLDPRARRRDPDITKNHLNLS